MVLPTPSATDFDPRSLKTYVDIDGRVGIFDGAGENRLDTGSNVYDFTVLAPAIRPSVSSTTSTTSTSTTTSTTTTSTSTTQSTTTIPWFVPTTLTPKTGAITSGTLRNVDLDDGTRLVLSEINATPAFEYEFEFGAGGDPVPTGKVRVVINGYYSGNPAHNVKIYAYDFTTLSWDALTADAGDFPSAGADQDYSFSTPAPAGNYLSGGRVYVQIDHVSPGNPTHTLNIDYMSLETYTTTT